MENLETRINNVMRGLRKEGFIARRNVMACCSGCVQLNPKSDEQPAFWQFGGQGHNIAIKGDEAYYAADPFRSIRGDLCIYFNHNALTDGEGNLTDAGVLLVELLTVNGIVFEWDFSQWQCIIINLDASTASAHAQRAAARAGHVDTMAFV